MDATYKKVLMDKYGITEEDAEVINELKKKIRKASPLTKEQKEACEVCTISSKKENIYNHHMVKVEYLAILVYYYGLWKKEKNKNYSPTHEFDEHKDETSSKEYIYVLKKDIDLYIPRVAICERHHNMIHELASDFEGSTSKELLKKAKPKELVYLYECFLTQDKEIYAHIFGEDESLDGREHYISYLKIWNDTVNVSMSTLLQRVEKKLESPEELGDKNLKMMIELAANIEVLRDEAQSALVALDEKFKQIGKQEGIEDELLDETVESSLEGIKIETVDQDNIVIPSAISTSENFDEDELIS